MDIARKMGLSASTVSEGVKKLGALGLVNHVRYKSVRLSAEGERQAIQVVRKHRLLETYLATELGYGWDEIHDEAESLEHAVSDLFIERIDKVLGFPERDPHGDPIPTADGHVPVTEALPLSTIPSAKMVRVVRVSDADPDVLKYLADLGVHPETDLDVTGVRASIGLLDVVIDGTPSALSIAAADAVWVRPLR